MAPMNHFSLRSQVAKFARESQCPKIVELRENYDQVIKDASGKETRIHNLVITANKKSVLLLNELLN